VTDLRYCAAGDVERGVHLQYLPLYDQAALDAAVAAERERWQRIATNAQTVTTECTDKIDYFEVPSHLMAALALVLDEGPNTGVDRP
jgi:hypothetical protein